MRDIAERSLRSFSTRLYNLGGRLIAQQDNYSGLFIVTQTQLATSSETFPTLSQELRLP